MEPNQPQNSFQEELNANNRTSRWLTVAIIIVIILIIGVIIWKVTAGRNEEVQAPLADNQNSLTPSVEGTSTAPLAKTVTVTLSDEGFSPASMTIDEGDTVKFVNESSGRMWVASDPHPSHSAYPGFDQKTAGEASSEYSFTFTKAGRWGYHNHLNPAQKGTVTVFTVGSK